MVIKNKLFGKFIKSTNAIIKEMLHNGYKNYRNIISTLMKQSKKTETKKNTKKQKKTMTSILKIISITWKISEKESNS